MILFKPDALQASLYTKPNIPRHVEIYVNIEKNGYNAIRQD